VEAYDLIYEAYTQKSKAFLVTGTPGIGKSLFKYYFAWRWMQEREYNGFLWQETSDTIIHFSPKEGCSFFDHKKGTDILWLPLFVDMEEKSNPTLRGALFTVVFSSPNPDRYKELMKKPNSKGFLHPPWSMDEILDAHMKIKRLHQYDAKVVCSQYAIYGGVPRELFDESAGGATNMLAALETKGLYAVNAMLRGHWQQPKDDDASHMILHMVPRVKGELTYKRHLLQPASAYVVSWLKELDLFELRSTYEGYARLRKGPYGATAGHIFEQLSLYYLPGKKHTIRQLRESSGSTSGNISASDAVAFTREVSVGPLDIMGTFHMTPEGKIIRGEDKWAPVRGMFYRQARATTESYDSFAITKEGELLIFQVTIAPEHPVKSNGLKLLLDDLKGHYDSCSLVFVVPEVSDLNKIQKLTTTNDTETQKLPLIVQEYKLNSIQWRLSSPDFDDMTTRRQKLYASASDAF